MENRIGIDGSVYYILILICVFVLLLSIYLVKHVLSSFSTNASKNVIIDEQEDSAVPQNPSRARLRGRGVQRLRMGLARRGEDLQDIAPRPNRNADNESGDNVQNYQAIDEHYEESGDEDNGADEGPSSSKIGFKKMRKLEMKAEKKAQREQEIAAREEKKQRDLASDQKKQTEEERLKAIQKQMEAEEKKRIEELRRKEELEYQALKKEFEIQEEGCDESLDFDKNESLVENFIAYCQKTKIIILEDLAANFKLKVQDVIKRLEDLMALGRINGVFDDRGKFIFITDQELEAVCKFIRERGRISISDLVENSSRLINLAPINS